MNRKHPSMSGIGFDPAMKQPTIELNYYSNNKLLQLKTNVKLVLSTEDKQLNLIIQFLMILSYII